MKIKSKNLGKIEVKITRHARIRSITREGLGYEELNEAVNEAAHNFLAQFEHVKKSKFSVPNVKDFQSVSKDLILCFAFEKPYLILKTVYNKHSHKEE